MLPRRERGMPSQHDFGLGRICELLEPSIAQPVPPGVPIVGGGQKTWDSFQGVHDPR